MKLFGHPDSGHAYKVRLMLTVAGIEHDYEQVDIWAPRDQRSEEFRRHARYHEVPLLIDDDEALVQSNAILLHLASRTGRWGAQTLSLQTLCREWLFWEANKIGLCLPQLRVRHRFDANAVNDGALDWLNRRYAHDVGLLENELADGRDWILSDRDPTVADFSLCGYLFFAEEAQVDVPPAVAAWLQRVAGLPGWQHPYDLMASA